MSAARPRPQPVDRAHHHNRDLLQRVRALPAGMAIARVFRQFVADKTIALTNDKANDRNIYQRFAAVVKRAEQRGELPPNHVRFNYRHGQVQERNAEWARLIQEHAQEMLPVTLGIRGHVYNLINRERASTADYTKVMNLIGDMRRADPDDPTFLSPDLIVDETCRDQGHTWGQTFSQHLDLMEDHESVPWDDQTHDVLVISEKQTIMPILQDTLIRERARAVPLGGNLHDGTAYRLAKRIVARQRPLVGLYVGDYDPSGLHICDVDGSGQVRDKIHFWLRRLDVAHPEKMFTIRRIALTTADTRSRELQKCKVPVKTLEWAQEHGKTKGDLKAKAYVAKHGVFGWEIDAMEPETLRQRVAEAIAASRNPKVWAKSLRREQQMRGFLTAKVARIRDAAEAEGWL